MHKSYWASRDFPVNLHWNSPAATFLPLGKKWPKDSKVSTLKLVSFKFCEDRFFLQTLAVYSWLAGHLNWEPGESLLRVLLACGNGLSRDVFWYMRVYFNDLHYGRQERDISWSNSSLIILHTTVLIVMPLLIYHLLRAELLDSEF